MHARAHAQKLALARTRPHQHIHSHAPAHTVVFCRSFFSSREGFVSFREKLQSHKGVGLVEEACTVAELVDAFDCKDQRSFRVGTPTIGYSQGRERVHMHATAEEAAVGWKPVT